jgi:thymidylate synthase ThyX
MRVELAGFTVSKKILDNLINMKNKVEAYQELHGDRDKLISDSLKDLKSIIHGFTPEAITAAYARISRSEKNVDELVEESFKDTDGARRSIFNILGMAHFSIADHSLFNFNIKDASRRVVEEIEARRLAGYTEKSQRYVTFGDDFHKPIEFSARDSKKHEEVVEAGINFYKRNNKKLFQHLKNKNLARIKDLEKQGDEKKLKDFLKGLENAAKEDARYGLSLATYTQLGCSYPGETLELAIRKNKYGELYEQQEFAKKLYDETVKIAPSLIQLTDPKLYESFNKGKKLEDDNFKFTKKNLEELVEKTINETPEHSHIFTFGHGNVKLVLGYGLQDYDLHTIAAIIHANSLLPVEKAYRIAKTIADSPSAGNAFMKEAFQYIGKHDKVPRECEMSGGFIYEILLSATNFAQLKRHRMATLLKQRYNPELGYTIPDLIREIGADGELQRVYDRASNLFYDFEPKYGVAAEYVLTNGHRRRVLLGVNLRELYHISRVRCDEHAQWDIRNNADSMVKLAKLVAPRTTLLLGGKSEFDDIKKELYKEE